MTSDSYSFEGQVVLVTGAAQGLGKATSFAFGRCGAKVAMVDLNEPLLNETVEELRKQGVECAGIVANIATSGAPEAIVQKTIKVFGGLNILVNNAGIQRKVGMPTNEPWEETEREISINLAAPVHLSSLLVPHLRRQAGSFIVNVSSGLAFVPMSPMPIYCATKAALHSFTLSLRSQLKSQSIGVIEIIPPAVKTNLGGSHDFGEDLADFTEGVIEQLKAGAPEITFGMSAKWSQLSRAEADSIFQQFNGGK